jgi:uncharacterized protein YjaG (DUF416 family)
MSTSELKTKLNDLVSKSKNQTLVSFAIDICKRLLPDYIFFSKKHNWGNPEILSKAIEYCEITLINQTDKEKVKELIYEIEKVTPDTEDFEDIEVSYALNSATSVLGLLEFIVTQDKIHISNVSSYITDTIDFKLGDLSNEELENHSEIIAEKLRQIEFLEINGA